MPLFYFHLLSASGTVERDEFGVELGSFELACMEAYRAAGSIAEELTSRHLDPLGYTFQIVDTAQRLLTEVPFAEVLQKQRNSPTATALAMRHASRHQFERARHLCREIARNEEALHATLAITQAKLKELRAQIDKCRPALSS